MWVHHFYFHREWQLPITKNLHCLKGTGILLLVLHTSVARAISLTHSDYWTKQQVIFPVRWTFFPAGDACQCVVDFLSTVVRGNGIQGTKNGSG